MSNRLDQEREKRLEPIRVKKAIDEINNRIPTVYYDDKKVWFWFKDEMVTYFAYSGWATGKSIKDGRGLKNLLKQLDDGKPV